jgi:dihydrofolate reductase
MQALGGPEEDSSGGFEQGGWLVPCAGQDMERLVADWLSAAGAFLLGRKTCQIFAAFWPHVTDQNDPVAAKLNSLPKYVAWTTLDKVDWTNSTLIKDDAAEPVAALKQQPGGELQVHRSGDIAQTLMRHDLIDEYRLWIYPVVLASHEAPAWSGELAGCAQARRHQDHQCRCGSTRLRAGGKPRVRLVYPRGNTS